MAEHDDKSAFQADIPLNAVEEALRSVERLAHERADPAGGTAIEVEAEGGAPADAGELAALRAQLELSQAKGRELLQKLKDEHERMLRGAADLENYKKRAARERDEVQRFGIEKVVKDLLPVVDGLDRAIAAAPAEGGPLADGVKLVRASLEQALSKHGVTAFSALGVRFDPALHEALMQVPTAEQPAGTVVLEHARGFKLNDRLVRPAMVAVAVAPPPAGDTAREG